MDSAAAAFSHVMRLVLKRSAMVQILVCWLSRCEEFLQMKKSSKNVGVFQIQVEPYNLFYSFVCVTVEQNNYNSAPASGHDNENLLSSKQVIWVWRGQGMCVSVAALAIANEDEWLMRDSYCSELVPHYLMN